MKSLHIVTIAAIIALIFGTIVFIDDAVNHRGYNWQTTIEYRQNLAQGKETKK